MNNKRIAEIESECPGCELHVVGTFPDGSALVLYIPPEEDRALGRANPEAAFQRVTTNVLMVIPPAEGAPLDMMLN